MLVLNIILILIVGMFNVNGLNLSILNKLNRRNIINRGVKGLSTIPMIVFGNNKNVNAAPPTSVIAEELGYYPVSQSSTGGE